MHKLWNRNAKSSNAYEYRVTMLNTIDEMEQKKYRPSLVEFHYDTRELMA